ncbi:ceramidase domain-containing protein [Sinisalibacter aestuarii]|uniref:Membrane protein n=1 Tax=Sinisalibacter aestuarii TaxID=2949426 RepID=A0ABQ5LUR4_9RHOB|nr:ceramidase domain-containing protein [Sinisalibacter aestuarii]GKY88368.1 membrane protein [Sinisalibacter aestuarii]
MEGSWTTAVDGYCERLDPGFWAEPVNAATNAAFLIAAAIMAWRLRGAHLPLANILTAILALIGIGSFLFHTFAERWAGLADTLPILLFILAYIYAATRDYLGARPFWAAAAVLGFFPYAAATVPLFALVPGLGSSAGYAPVPVLIAAYAVILRHRAPATARGLAIGAGLLVLSLTFRTLDEPLCAALPLGTHFLWHILNAVMLGWMIEVYRRHGRAPLAPAGQSS